MKIILNQKEICQWQCILTLKQLLQPTTVLIQNKKKMFVISYVLIVAFHTPLNLRNIIVQRNYGHSLEQLTMIDYLTNDQMSFIDVTLVKQLNDIAQEVSRRKWNNALGQMFVIETDLIKKHW